MTEQEKLEAAREAAVLWCGLDGQSTRALNFKLGNIDDGVSVQSALAAINLMLERGYVLRPSVADLDRAVDSLARKTWYSTNDYRTALLTALFPPTPDPSLAPLREIARDGVTDEELRAALEKMKGEVQ